MKFDDAKKLQQKKYREALGHYLVEGEHLVLELQKAAASNPVLQSCKLYVAGSHERWRGPFETHVLNERQMAQLSETETPQGIVAVVPILPAIAPRAGERCIYLHAIQDPGNLGSILRTLAWFGGFRCLLGPGSVDPYNAKAVRASMGAIFHVPVELDVGLETLGTRFQRIAYLDMTGESLSSPSFGTHDCYLFGNEARGVPREHLASLGAHPFTIKGTRLIESLNVAAAVNVCAYELHRAVD